jgi:hypothetical protein
MQEASGIAFFADHINALTENFDLNFTYGGAPYFGNLEAVLPTASCVKSSTSIRLELMLGRPAEAAAGGTAKSTERVISKYSTTRTDVFRDFPLL